MQISLRAFLALLTAACLWLGYLANRAHRQRAAVAAIHGLGGSVWYEFEEPDFFGSPVHAPGRFGRLREWLGRDLFEKVVVVRYPAIERDAYGYYRLREDTFAARHERLARRGEPAAKRVAGHVDFVLSFGGWAPPARIAESLQVRLAVERHMAAPLDAATAVAQKTGKLLEQIVGGSATISGHETIPSIQPEGLANRHVWRGMFLWRHVASASARQAGDGEPGSISIKLFLKGLAHGLERNDQAFRWHRMAEAEYRGRSPGRNRGNDMDAARGKD